MDVGSSNNTVDQGIVTDLRHDAQVLRQRFDAMDEIDHDLGYDASRLMDEAANHIEMLEGQMAGAFEAAQQGLTWRAGAPGGWEVTDPGKLIMVWSYLAAARSLT